jgi:hypothetical protein
MLPCVLVQIDADEVIVVWFELDLPTSTATSFQDLLRPVDLAKASHNTIGDSPNRRRVRPNFEINFVTRVSH